MICVLEGSDGSGKTTLATNLKKTWEEARDGNEALIVHTGPPGSWDEREMSLANWRKYCFLRIKAVLDMVEPHDGRTLLILDRAHVGSPVYGRLFRPQVDHDGFGDLGKRYFSMLDQYLVARGGITLHISPPLETVLRRTLARSGGEDEFLDQQDGSREQQITNIYNEYYSFIKRERDSFPSYAGSGVFTSSTALRTLHAHTGLGNIADEAST